MNCPHCGKSINAALRKIAAKGGRKKSAAKTEAARNAIKIRWERAKTKKPRKGE